MARALLRVVELRAPVGVLLHVALQFLGPPLQLLGLLKVGPPRQRHLQIAHRVAAARDVVREAAAQPHARPRLQVGRPARLGGDGVLALQRRVDLARLLVLAVLLAQVGDLEHRLGHVGGARRAPHDRLIVLAHEAVREEREAEPGLLFLDHRVHEPVAVFHELLVSAVARVEVQQVFQLVERLLVVLQRTGQQLHEPQLRLRRLLRNRPFAHERVVGLRGPLGITFRLKFLREGELLRRRVALDAEPPALLAALGLLHVVEPVEARIGVRRIRRVAARRGPRHAPRRRRLNRTQRHHRDGAQSNFPKRVAHALSVIRFRTVSTQYTTSHAPPPPASRRREIPHPGKGRTPPRPGAGRSMPHRPRVSRQAGRRGP